MSPTIFIEELLRYYGAYTAGGHNAGTGLVEKRFETASRILEGRDTPDGVPAKNIRH